jgi:hypothetical protein
MTEAKLNEIYVSFITELKNAGVDTEKLIEFIGEERLKNSPAGLELSSGLAFPGALLLLMITSLRYARQLVDMSNNEFKIDPKSLTKVALLHHIGKAVIYEENNDEWQRNKRGMLYKWVDNETILKAGERSLYILQRCGIELTESEFEAMKINDKTDDDKFSMLHITPLSMIIKMADDLSYMRVNYKQKNK